MMNDIIVVSILFYISIKREFVCSPSAFCFIFDESPKTKEEEKSKNRRTRREERDRSKIAESLSLSLFLFLSLSPVPSCNGRALLATSILKQSRRKALKIPSM